MVVYVHRDSQIKANVNTNDSKNLYSWHFEIKCPSINETYENKTNIFGTAVYFMTFSEDNRYLMVYFQIVDNYQIRQNKDREGNYIVWDNFQNSPVKDWDRQKDAVFKHVKFPNHIYGKYQYFEGTSTLIQKTKMTNSETRKIYFLNFLEFTKPIIQSTYPQSTISILS